MKKFTTSLLLLTVALSANSQQLEKFIGKDINKGFIENNGQVRDQNGKPNTSVNYIFNQGIFNLELKKSGFSYEVFNIIPDQNPDEAGFTHNNDIDDSPQDETRLASSHRVDVEFVGANSKCVVIPSDKNDWHYNYYIAPITENRIENVNSFQTITYQNIYPGIDLVFTAPNQESSSLEYKFIVHSGADPNHIHMRYTGANNLSLTENGFLHIDCSNGFIEEGNVQSFIQGTNEAVGISVMVEKNSTRFNLDNYEKNKTLIIDPSIFWGTYYGGENTEDVAEIAVDSEDKPTIGGNTLSTTNIATSGAYQTTFGGGFHDFFVAKFNATGQIEWATYLGGSGRDIGFGVSVDQEDDIFFNGKTTSDGLASPGAHQTIRGGLDDAIVAKFDKDGPLLWCSYFGGAGDDQFRAFTFDADNNMYIDGYTESASAISTPGAFQEVYGGGGDGMISKWTTDGVVVWSTYYGGIGQDRYHGASVDPFGNLYVVGTTSSDDQTTTSGSYQTTYAGGDADLWLSKFTLDGDLIWSTLYGGEEHDRGRGVEIDDDGNVYVAGFTNSTTGIATTGAVQETWSEGYDNQTGEGLDDAMLFSITSDGTTRLWGTYYGGGTKEELWGMNIDRKQKCLYIVGSTQSDFLIAYGNAWQPVKGKGSDAYFARWTYDGAITYGSYFGKDDGEQFEDVEVDQNSYIYLVGKTEANQLPATYGVYQTHNNGGDFDGLVYKFYGGIACADLNEPNDNFNSAKTVYARTIDDSLIYGYDGNLNNSADKDFYKITVALPYKNLLVNLTGLSHNYDLKFYNSSHQLKAQSTKTGLVSDTLFLNNLPAGDYYLRVVAGSPVQYDTMKCYHLNLVKSTTKFKHNFGEYRQVAESESSDLRIYPNPSSSEINIELTSEKEEQAQLQIFDLSGHLVIARPIDLAEGLQQIQLPIDNLSSGIYNAVISSSDKTWVNLIVKE